MFWIILISRSRRSAYSARSCFSAPLARIASRRGAALLEALPRDVLEVGVGGVLGRDVEARERLLDLFQLDVAALRDLPGAVERVLELAEQLHHFVARSSGRNRACSSASGSGR